MRRTSMVAMAGLVGVVGLGVPATSAAGLTTYCDGTASGVTVPGDLVVAAGDSCELTDVQIAGDVVVRAGANLLVVDTTVAGDLVVAGDGYADLADSRVDGTTGLRSAYGAYAEGSTLAGRVAARESGFYYAVGSHHDDDVVSVDGETVVEDGWVAGDLRTRGDLRSDVHDTVVEGRLTVTEAEQGATLCASEVDGDATIRGSAAGAVQVSGSTPIPDCGFNVLGGTLRLIDNAASVDVAGNVIRGDLVCRGNDPLPSVADNRVRGDVLCETSTGAEATSRDSSASGSVADQNAAVRAKIDLRRQTAQEAAEQAGPAFG